MKKLLLILLCVPLMFSCREETDNLRRDITQEMIDNEYTGKGTFTWADGSKYVGEFKNGEKHGHGTLTYKKGKYKGDKYVGKWKYDVFHGKGTYTFSEGNK